MSKKVRIRSVYGVLKTGGTHRPGEGYESDIGIVMVGIDMPFDQLINVCLKPSGMGIFKEYDRKEGMVKADRYEKQTNPYFYAWDTADDWNLTIAEGRKWLPKYTHMEFFLPDRGSLR